MRVLDFPYCCTAKIIVDFGESYVAEGGSHAETYAGMWAYLMEVLKNHEYSEMAMLVATTNDQQHTANRVLADIGFYQTGWMTKEQHPDTQVCMWWLPIAEFKSIHPWAFTHEQGWVLSVSKKRFDEERQLAEYAMARSEAHAAEDGMYIGM